jgi:ferritin-like metal-binding protein YciE
MSVNTPEELFLHGLKDAYSAEKQILAALPKVIAEVEDEDLKQGLEDHRMQTEVHVERLDQIFTLLEEVPEAQTCMAMKGILAEGDETMKSVGPEVRDLAITGAARRIEHYEQAVYGSLVEMAEALNYSEARDLLQETFDEEVEAGNLMQEAALSLLDVDEAL